MKCCMYDFDNIPLRVFVPMAVVRESRLKIAIPHRVPKKYHPPMNLPTIPIKTASKNEIHFISPL